MKRAILYTIGFISIWFWTTGASCTKVIAYGVDHHTPAVSHSYSSNVTTVLQQAQDALKSLGYNVLRVDESRNRITTGWEPTKSDSHYMLLFQRRDYAASSGSYYQLIVDIHSDGPKVNVAASTIVKSIAGRLSSSKELENKFLGRLDNFMRSPQIEMTNVGVKER